MKKITLALFMALSSLAVSAQDYYNFTKLNQPYTELQDAISVNNGEIWMFDTFGEFSIPFPFTVMGNPVDRFLFDDDAFILMGTGVDYDIDGEGFYYMYPSNIYMQDRTYSSEVSSSPISYKVEGTTGNRILKLEVKNATLEFAEDYGYAEDYFYLSYQVWLYEANNVIEFHYGTNNITDIDNITDGEGIIVALGDDYNTVGFVYGDTESPDYGEYTEATFPDEGLSLNSYPANGTVYRFMHGTPAAINSVKANTLSLYPNPASSVLTIKSADAMISQYSIFDVTGKVVLQNKVTAAQSTSINVANLSPGVYFVKTDNGTALKFVKN
ncbi:T9SS type A sorting domain-containing protein [Flavobacterium sp. RHBU_3]|uniref:T9SS type A sorting domain-containing protein n=1 Tax=Flavobacterium sp. RHBU_3 TaxID=3391184 RepID=UPI003984B873